MPVDPAIVRRRLRKLERCLRVLRSLREQGRAAFVGDEVVQDRAERNAELVAQSCIDIAIHIVTGLGARAPDTYADALVDLARSGVVPADVATRMAAAAKLRNILVHGYLDVDHGRLFDELGWIDDAQRFGEHVERWLARQAS